jgi:hydrogenase maturation protease
MPSRLIVHAIEAADLTLGTGLTPLVAAAVDEVAGADLSDLNRWVAAGLSRLRRTARGR